MKTLKCKKCGANIRMFTDEVPTTCPCGGEILAPAVRAPCLNCGTLFEQKGLKCPKCDQPRVVQRTIESHVEYVGRVKKTPKKDA